MWPCVHIKDAWVQERYCIMRTNFVFQMVLPKFGFVLLLKQTKSNSTKNYFQELIRAVHDMLKKDNRFWSLCNKSLVKKMWNLVNLCAIENGSSMFLHFSVDIQLPFLLLFHTSKFSLRPQWLLSSLNLPGCGINLWTFPNKLCIWRIHLTMVYTCVNELFMLRNKDFLQGHQTVYLVNKLISWV